MKKFIKSLIAGAVVAASLILVPTLSQAATSSSAGCTNLPDPYNTAGTRYQMQKYFSVAFDRAGDVGTATVTTKPGVRLCSDAALSFQSFNMGPNWDQNNPDIVQNFVSSLPQTVHSANVFVFGKNDTSKTVTVKTPDACYGTQLDVYVGHLPVEIITGRFQHEQREITGKIFLPNGSCAPQYKDIQVCDLTTNKVITIREDQFDGTKHSTNLDDCKLIAVCELSSNTLITIKEKDFDATKHSKDIEDCSKVEVCDTTTKTIITIPKNDMKPEYTTDTTKCNTKVCRIEDKTTIVINDEEYQKNKDRYTTDMSKCDTPAPETPEVPELPHTGFDGVLSGIIGLGSITAAGAYYATTRRQ